MEGTYIYDEVNNVVKVCHNPQGIESNTAIKDFAKSIAINKIHYILKGDKIGDIKGKEINKLTVQEIHKQLENMYMSGNLVALEIDEKSDNSMRILSIYFDDVKFCIGIVDEWDDTVYYYSSGESDELEDIQGNVYPKHMISSDKEILFLIIDEFVKNGKPTKMVKWIKE